MKKTLTDIISDLAAAPPGGRDFLIVANFAYSETIAGEPVNTYSGLTDEAFNYLMEDTAESLEAEVMFCDGNTAVVQGRPERLKLIEQLCGPRFSYAYCNGVEAQSVMDRCLQAAIETPEEREARQIPGAQDFRQTLN